MGIKKVTITGDRDIKVVRNDKNRSERKKNGQPAVVEAINVYLEKEKLRVLGQQQQKQQQTKLNYNLFS